MAKLNLEYLTLVMKIIKFFTDETGADSSLVVTAPNGTTTTIALTDINVAITNGNELPGSLVESTSEIGKTFTV